MKNISRITIIGLLMLMAVSWLLNCKGVGSVNATSIDTQPFLQKVAYSDWIEAQNGKSTRLFDLPARFFEYKNAQLSPQKLEESDMFVYIQLENQSIKTLPFTTEDTNLRFDYTVPQTYTLNLATISMNGSTTKPQPFKFRYILVPKELSSKIKINLLDYASVKAALSLPE